MDIFLRYSKVWVRGRAACGVVHYGVRPFSGGRTANSAPSHSRLVPLLLRLDAPQLPPSRRKGISVRFFTNRGGDGRLKLHTGGPIIDQYFIVLGSIPVGLEWSASERRTALVALPPASPSAIA